MFIQALRVDKDELTEEFLQEALIEADREEGKTIEYKRKFGFKCTSKCKINWLHGASDDEQQQKIGRKDEKLEFFKDVSSFANTSGGALIYGIEAQNAHPTEIIGLDIPSDCTEKLENSLNELILNHITPRIAVNFAPVHLKNGKIAYVLDIHKSWTGPHQVTYDSHNKFYARSAGAKHKYEMDFGQLRAAFLLSATLIERIRRFRADRLSTVIAGDTPALLYDDHTVILHLIPLTAFDPARQYKLTELKEDHNNVQPFSTDVAGAIRPNIDGIVSNTSAGEAGRSTAYIQVFRNSTIESVDSSSFIGHYPRSHLKAPRVLWINEFEAHLIVAVERYLHIFSKLGVATPAYLFLTLAGVSDVLLLDNAAQPVEADMRRGAPIDRDIVMVPEICITNDGKPVHTMLRSAIDSVWNACGREKSPNFTEDGSYASRLLTRTTPDPTEE